jgi:hypothetical protein
MATEIKADEAILWLRSYHAETVCLALEGFGLWRDFAECCSNIAGEDGWSKAPQAVRDSHQRLATRIAEIRKLLEDRN